MASRSPADTNVDVFKALADPIRWEILRQVSETGELACSLLEDSLPVSKPTISYHTKILQQAGLISTRRVSRNSFYVLRPDALRSAIDSLGDLVPAVRPVDFGGATIVTVEDAEQYEDTESVAERLATW